MIFSFEWDRKVVSFQSKGYDTMKEKKIFGDKVRVISGFYEGQTAILTYYCPETGCLCGFIEGDGTEQLHYFFEEQLEVIDRGYFFPYDTCFEDEEDDTGGLPASRKLFSIKQKPKAK